MPFIGNSTLDLNGQHANRQNNNYCYALGWTRDKESELVKSNQ